MFSTKRFKLLLFILFIICHCKVLAYTFNFDAWSENYHENGHSSASLNDPIINNMEWFFVDIYNNTIYSNILILTDQSIIMASSQSNNSISINRYSYQGIKSSMIWSTSIENITITSSDSITMVTYEPIGFLYIYFKEMGQFQTLNLTDGNIFWVSDSQFFNCTQAQFIPFNNIGYSLCQSSVDNQVSMYLHNLGKKEIWLMNWNLYTLRAPPNTLPNNTELISPITQRDLLGFVLNFNQTFTHVDYLYNGTGLISMVDLIMEDVYSMWTLSYHSGKVQYILDQINGVVVSGSKETISMLVCVGDNSIYLDSYYVNGEQIHSQIIVSGLSSCTDISNSKVGYLSDMESLVIMLTIFDNSTGNDVIQSNLAIVTPKSLRWVIHTQQDARVLDFASTIQDSIYICTDSSLILYNYTSKTQKSLDFTSEISLVSCWLSIGENSVILSGIDINNQNIFMKAIDSFCGVSLCPENFTCGVEKCQCAINYYPDDICTTYCDPYNTCSSNGVCSETGECICDPTTGYSGPACAVCKKGYFGGACNFHFDWKEMTVAGVIAFLVTSGICIFWCVTTPKKQKKKLSKFRRLFIKIKSLFSCVGNVKTTTNNSKQYQILSSGNNSPTISKIDPIVDENNQHPNNNDKYQLLKNIDEYNDQESDKDLNNIL